MPLIPLHDRVLIKHLESGRDQLWLPDDAGFLQRGLVMEMGEDVKFLHQHDVVMFKTDEALRLRVPIDVPDPRGAFARYGPMDPAGQELEPAGAEPSVEETLFLIPELGVYLILERVA